MHIVEPYHKKTGYVLCHIRQMNIRKKRWGRRMIQKKREKEMEKEMERVAEGYLEPQENRRKNRKLGSGMQLRPRKK